MRSIALKQYWIQIVEPTRFPEPQAAKASPERQKSTMQSAQTTRGNIERTAYQTSIKMVKKHFDSVPSRVSEADGLLLLICRYQLPRRLLELRIQDERMETPMATACTCSQVNK
jgi:hypothetical protein